MNLYYFILIVLAYVNVINVHTKTINVNNENDLINILNNDSKDILIINIDNVKIEIMNNIYIEDSNYKKISINGKDIKSSILNFNDDNFGLIFSNTYNNTSINEINFNNLSINGNLEFRNFNYNITINNVTLNGNIDFNSKTTEKSTIILNNFQYYSGSTLRNHCINLCGNIKIDNSSFYGSDLCKRSIIYYHGNSVNTVEINNSYFDGAYSNNCISIIDSLQANIYLTTFEKCASYNEEGGGAIHVKHSNIIIEHCHFNNNFSLNHGGAIYVYDSYVFRAKNIEITKTTAIKKGSFLYMYSSVDYKTEGYIANVIQTDTGNIEEVPIIDGGLIASIEGYSNLYIENFYGNNLNGGNGAFTLTKGSTIEIKNIELSNISSTNIGGVLLTSNDEEEGSFFRVNNGTFTEFYQNCNRESSSLIRSSNNIDITLENCNIEDIHSLRGNFIYTIAPSKVELNNVFLEGHYSTNLVELIQCSSYNNNNICTLILNDVTIDNFESMNGIINTNLGDITINNSMISNVYICVYSSYCDEAMSSEENKLDGYIFKIGSGSNVTISDTTFDTIMGYIGFKAEKSTNIEINNSAFNYVTLFNSLIVFDKKTYGHYLINNTQFNFNSADKGGIVRIEEIDENSSLIISDSLFDSNYASYGGIIYSKSKLTNKYVKFNNCELSENAAYEGGISYSLSKNYEPYFSNIDELRENEHFKETEFGFSTNPSKIRFTNDSLTTFSILSGDMIPNGMKCEFVDDYGNVPKVLYNSIERSKYSDDNFNNYVFFNLEVDDSNVAIIGNSLAYCILGGCTLPIVKIIGNPGHHKLIFKVDTYGHFQEFENNTFEIDFTINECDESIYRYKDIENLGLKSCFEPKCLPTCINSGICVSNNVCDCSNTQFKGLYCEEHYKLERNIIIDRILRSISIGLIIISVIIFISLIIFKNNQILKSGSVDFLIIMLFGIAFNCHYIISLTHSKTKKSCILGYIANNLGFSLVFGSITIKTYRIYRIFTYVYKLNRGLKKSSMYLFVFAISMVHIILILSWVVTDTVKSTNNYTNDNKEFRICSYPKSKIIGTLFNIVTLFLGWVLTYASRSFKKEFKEDMDIPAYVYVIFTVFIEIITMDDGINIVVQDFFIGIGTIIHVVITIYFIYIKKFNTMYYHAYEEYNSQFNSALDNNLQQSKENKLFRSKLDILRNSQMGSQKLVRQHSEILRTKSIGNCQYIVKNSSEFLHSTSPENQSNLEDSKSLTHRSLPILH